MKKLKKHYVLGSDVLSSPVEQNDEGLTETEETSDEAAEESNVEVPEESSLESPEGHPNLQDYMEMESSTYFDQGDEGYDSSEDPGANVDWGDSSEEPFEGGGTPDDYDWGDGGGGGGGGGTETPFGPIPDGSSASPTGTPTGVPLGPQPTSETPVTPTSSSTPEPTPTTPQGGARAISRNVQQTPVWSPRPIPPPPENRSGTGGASGGGSAGSGGGSGARVVSKKMQPQMIDYTPVSTPKPPAGGGGGTGARVVSKRTQPAAIDYTPVSTPKPPVPRRSGGAVLVRGDVSLTSPILGVSDEAWSKFATNMQSAPVGAVSASNALGMFEMKPRRLVDLGLVENTAMVRSPKSGRMIWVGDFVPPLSAKEYLRDPVLQYKTFCASMKDYCDKVKNGQVAVPDGGRPKDMTISGALAVLHRCGPSGLKTWNDEENRFPDTVNLYERVNGIF